MIEDLAGTDGIPSGARDAQPHRRGSASTTLSGDASRRRRALRGDAAVRAVPAPDRRARSRSCGRHPPRRPASAHPRRRRDRDRSQGSRRSARSMANDHDLKLIVDAQEGVTRASSRSCGRAARPATGCGSYSPRSPDSGGARCRSSTRSTRSTKPGRTSVIRFRGRASRVCRAGHGNDGPVGRGDPRRDRRGEAPLVDDALPSRRPGRAGLRRRAGALLLRVRTQPRTRSSVGVSRRQPPSPETVRRTPRRSPRSGHEEHRRAHRLRREDRQRPPHPDEEPCHPTDPPDERDASDRRGMRRRASGSLP